MLLLSKSATKFAGLSFGSIGEVRGMAGIRELRHLRGIFFPQAFQLKRRADQEMKHRLLSETVSIMKQTSGSEEHSVGATKRRYDHLNVTRVRVPYTPRLQRTETAGAHWRSDSSHKVWAGKRCSDDTSCPDVVSNRVNRDE